MILRFPVVGVLFSSSSFICGLLLVTSYRISLFSHRYYDCHVTFIYVTQNNTVRNAYLHIFLWRNLLLWTSNFCYLAIVYPWLGTTEFICLLFMLPTWSNNLIIGANPLLTHLEAAGSSHVSKAENLLLFAVFLILCHDRLGKVALFLNVNP